MNRTEINFSVVIPLYNKEKSILNTVCSVLEQSYPNFELIVVNDGSTDGSLEVVKQMTDDRIRIVDKKNGGVSSARNAGIRSANHQWVALLDGDDVWLPDFLKMVCTMIEKYPEAEVISLGWKNDVGKYEIPYSKEGYIDNYHKVSLKGAVLHSSSTVIKNTAFQSVGFFNEALAYGEDIEMWSRLSEKTRIAFSPTPMSVYRLVAENRVCENPRLNIEKHIACHFSLQDMKSKDEKRYYRKIILDCMMHCMKYHDSQSLNALIRKHGKKEILFDFVRIYSTKACNLLKRITTVP